MGERKCLPSMIERVEPSVCSSIKKECIAELRGLCGIVCDGDGNNANMPHSRIRNALKKAFKGDFNVWLADGCSAGVCLSYADEKGF